MSAESNTNHAVDGAPERPSGKANFSRAQIANLLLRNLMALVVVAVAIYFSVASPNFATLANMRTILIAAAPFALIALGQTLVILTGGIDLSVGSVLALSAMTSAAVAEIVARDHLTVATVPSGSLI